MLQKAGNPAKWGDDFGGDEETILSKNFEKPVIIHRYPSAMKAFYMAADPARPDLALNFDMIAPEGYGEIIGGGERQSSYETLLKRIREQGTTRRIACSGISICGATAAFRTPDLAWASNAPLHGFAGRSTSAK